MKATTKLIIGFDDREMVNAEIQGIVGTRHYGDIFIRGKSLTKHFQELLPQKNFFDSFIIQNDSDLEKFRKKICQEKKGRILIISSRSGFTNSSIGNLIEKLPYAKDNFVDRSHKPLIYFNKNASSFLDLWDEFSRDTLAQSEKNWGDENRIESIKPCDLSDINDFLNFISGATKPRLFNNIKVNDYFYIKKSTNKSKIKAEYLFYTLVPEEMRPWLVETFDYQDYESESSYKMMRYYASDVGFQWVHEAFNSEQFKALINRILFFIKTRPQRKIKKSKMQLFAYNIYVEKPRERLNFFLSSPEGRHINDLIRKTNNLDLKIIFDRYSKLFDKYKKSFYFDYEVIGHGDPCFSNILYDQKKYFLKFIDPKGAINNSELWTHPLYDICKVSHSILGDYDYINNGLYKISLNANGILELDKMNNMQIDNQSIFIEEIIKMGINLKALRVAEISLFLSMLPFHTDNSDKVIAFILRAEEIINQLEN